MTKEEFRELIGENPADVLGADWSNLVDDWDEEEVEKDDDKFNDDEDISEIE
jgi:hypothetical protein